MSNSFRASFDTLYHSFDFNFSSDADALRYVRSFSGDPVVQHQAIHELTHYYFSISPVTRAIRALRNKALFEMIVALHHIDAKQLHKINKDQLFRAIHQWRMADAITQYLLPLYEGTALMAEFDCCPIPVPSDCDLLTFIGVQMEQSVATIRSGELSDPGLHQRIGYPNLKEAPFLDAMLDRITSSEIKHRKMNLLNLPLMYEKPSDCYLVAWLFARQAHLHISRAVDDNVSPFFVIKYLRSYFFEDWECVSKILDIFYWRKQSTSAVISHLEQRLDTFSRGFTRRQYEEYREGVLDVRKRGEQNWEFLPGLLGKIDKTHCHDIFNQLQEAMYLEFAPGKQVKVGSVGREVYAALLALQNRQGFIAIHQGQYEAEAASRKLRLLSGDETLTMNMEEDHLDRQTCRVTFYLSCAGEVLQRIARVHTPDKIFTAWIGGREPGAFVTLGGAFDLFETGEVAQVYIESHLRFVREQLKKEFAGAIEEGCISGRAIFLNWLKDQGGFYRQLRELSHMLGYKSPPNSTFVRLFRDFFSKEHLDQMIEHSLIYGIGYNVGKASRGRTREYALRGQNFAPEIEALYSIRDRTGIEDFHFFYCEDESDGYEIPRFYF